MEMVWRLLDEISCNTFEVGKCVWVDVVHVNNPHSFYVRPRTYNKYLHLLQARGEHPDPSKITIDDVYIFNSYMLNCAVRGKIVFCDKRDDRPTYKLFAIDIGCTEDGVTIDRIWTALYPFEVPPLITHCQLDNCAPRGETWGYNAIDAMRRFVIGERAKMIIRSQTPDNLLVELYNSRPDNIATLLAVTNFTSVGYSGASASNLENPQQVSRFYAQRPMQIGEDIRVRMQSGLLPEQFFAIPVEEYPLYETDRDNYTLCARSQDEVPIEDLKINGPIGVLYQKHNKYERGLVKEVYLTTNRAKIQLVDLGITIEDSIMKMKAIPDWYLRVPVRALLCTLHSNQSLTNDVPELSYPGTEFVITIKAIGDEDSMRPHVVMVSPLKSD